MADRYEPSIPLNELHEHPDNPRKIFNQQKLEELASSIRSHGVVHPLLVRLREKGGYEVIAGHRRLRAARLAELGEVPATIRDLTDHAAVEIMVIENSQRAVSA